MKLRILFFLIFLITKEVFSQCGTHLTVNNPSFEGTPQAHVTPGGWDICMPGLTPDTQPGFWNIFLPPTNGISYIGLAHDPSIPWQEGAGQTLSSPMVAGLRYHFTIDLATVNVVGYGILPGSVELQLWGGWSGGNGCSMAELLWHSGNVTNLSWVTQDLDFTPSDNYDHVLFLVNALDMTKKPYILLDNMSSIVPINDMINFSAASILPGGSLCDGAPVQFTDLTFSPGGYTTVLWDWDFGDGSPGSALQNPIHIFPSPGVYSVTLTTTNNIGCVYTITKNIEILALPDARFSMTDFCAGNTLNTFNTTTFNHVPIPLDTLTSFHWEVSDGFSSQDFSISGHTISQPGTFDVRLWAMRNGCADTMHRTLTVHPIPSVNLGNDTNICIGAHITLDACNAGCTYLWSDLSSGRFQSVINDGIYAVTVTSANNCFGTDSIWVNTFLYASPSISGNNPVCAGATELYSTPWLAQASYVWSVTGGSIIAGAGTNTVSILWDGGQNGTIDLVEHLTNSDCISRAIFHVNVHPNPVIHFPSVPDFCTGDPGYILNSATPSGGNYYIDNQLSFSINPGSFIPGTHHIVYFVTDSNGCSDTASNDFIIYQSPDALISPSVASVCQGNNVTLFASGADFYNWAPAAGLSSPGMATTVAAPSVTTVYTVTASSSNGCIDTATVRVNIFPRPVVDFPSVPDFCINDQTYALTAATPINGQYRINGIPVHSVNPALLGPGVFSISYRYTDSNGCSDSVLQTFHIYDNPELTVNPLYAEICVGGSVLLNANGADNYLWSPSSTLSSEVTASTVASPASTTVYLLNATNSFGCSDTASVRVIVNQLPVVTFPVIHNLCSNDEVISLDMATPAGGTYRINGIISQSIDPGALGPGTYHIVYSFHDTHGCTDSIAQDFTILDIPHLSANPSNPEICYGQSIPLSLSGAHSYLWDPVNGLSTLTAGNALASPLTSTTYTITGYNLNGCSDTIHIPVNIHPLPIITFLPIPDLCPENPVYQLNNATPSNGNYSIGGTVYQFINPQNLSPGTYAVVYQYTDGYGCSSSDTNDFHVFAPPRLSANPLISSICPGENIRIQVSGAYDYVWSPAVGLSSTDSADITASPTVTTMYTVIGKTSEGCTDSIQISVEVNPSPSVAFPPLPDFCTNDPVFHLNTATPPGGQYTINGIPYHFIDPGLSDTGLYHVTYHYTNAFGCSDSSDSYFNINPPPNLIILPSNPSICSGGNVNLSANGAGSYRWYPSTGLSDPLSSSTNAAPAATTMYALIGTSGTGCHDTAYVNVLVNETPTVYFPPVPDFCHNSPAINLHTATPQGGVYSINGIPLSVINPATSPPGNYHIIYTFMDANGCTDSASSDFSIYGIPLLSATPTDTILCQGQSVYLSASGADSYSWSPAAGLSSALSPTTTATPAVTTTYTLAGANLYGCSDTIQITINVFPVPIVTFPSVPDICMNDPIYQLNTASPAGGVYTINGNNLSVIDPNVLGTGMHHIVYNLSNNYGCSDSTGHDFEIFDSPHLFFSPVNPVICRGDTVRLTVSGADFYSWLPHSGITSPSSSSTNASPSVTTSYTVTGRSVQGCISSENITVTVNQLPLVQFPFIPDMCENDAVYFLNTATPIGGSYFINGIQHQSIDPGVIGTGTYYILYRYADNNGCIGSIGQDFIIKDSPLLLVNPSNISLCNGDSTTITASGADIYKWLPATGLSDPNSPSPFAFPSNTTTYHLSASMLNGCTDSAQVNIIVNPLPVVIFPPLNNFCTADAPFALNTATPAGGEYFINGAIYQSVNPAILGPGSYYVDYYYQDTNGCSSSAENSFYIYSTPWVNISPIHPAICFGDSILLTGEGADLYTWSPALGLNTPGLSNTIASPQLTTTYTLTGTTNDGCSDTARVILTVYPPVNVSLPQINDLCSYHENIELNMGLPPGGMYLLNGSPETQILPSLLSEGAYSLTYNYTDSNSCVHSREVSFHVYTQPDILIQPGDTAICRGDSILLTATGADEYSWFPPSGLSASFIPNPYAFPANNTAYTVTGSHNACYDTAKVIIRVLENPVIDLGEDMVFCNLSRYVLRGASFEYSYLWQDGSNGPEYLVTEPGKYWVQVQLDRCILSDTIQIYPCPDIFFPNAFTPDGNLLNESFFGHTFDKDLFTKYDLIIFNRWGGIIYRAQSLDEKWDGTFNGTKCPEGTYVWMVQYSVKGIKGKDIGFKKYGIVTLVR